MRFRVGGVVLLLSVLLLPPVARGAVDYDIFMITAGGINNSLVRVDETNGSVIGQVPLPANFRPSKLRASGDGKLYVTSYLDNAYIKIDPLTGTVLETVSFTQAYGVVEGPDALYVAQAPLMPMRTVHRLTTSGGADIPADGFPIGTYQNNIPIDLELAPTGELFVAATRMRSYDPVTGAQTSFVLSNPSSGVEPSAGFFTFGPGGDLFVSNNISITRYDAGGAFKNVFATGLSAIGGSQGSGTILFGPNGNLYASEYASALVEFNGTTGALVHRFPTGVGDFTFAPVPEPTLVVAMPLVWMGLSGRRRRAA